MMHESYFIHREVGSKMDTSFPPSRVSCFCSVPKKKKKKENQTPLILSSNISRAHATSTLYSSSFFSAVFSFYMDPTLSAWPPDKLNKPSKTPKVVYKKKKIYIQTQEDEIKPSIMLCSILNSQSPNNGGACS